MDRRNQESSAESALHHPLATAALSLIIIVGAVAILYFARGLLIPLVFAVMLLFILDSLNDLWRRILPERLQPPTWLITLLSFGVLIVVLGAVAVLVVDNTQQLAAAAPRYQERFEQVYDRDIEPLIEAVPGLEGDNLGEKLNVGGLIGRVAAGLASAVGQAGLVLMFLTFLLLDRRFGDRKMERMFPDPEARRHADGLFRRIEKDVRAYLGMKSFVSLLTAVPSYLVMSWVGLDFASFWALLIFIFNFVPNIGSLVATVMPTALAFVQFETAGPVLTVGLTITAIQLIVANLIEPQLMSRALNMSAFIVVFSLVAFGLVWGMAGVFLCVPLTTILILICARFETTRSIAILLSRDGEIDLG